MSRYRTYSLLAWLWIYLFTLPSVCHADAWENVSEKIARATAASLKSGDIILFFCPTCGGGGYSYETTRGSIEIYDITSVKVISVQEDDSYRDLGYRDSFLVRFWGNLIVHQEIEPPNRPTAQQDILPIDSSQCIDRRVRPMPPGPNYVAFNYHYMRRANGMFILTGKRFGLRPSKGNEYNVPPELKVPEGADAIFQKCRKAARRPSN